MNPVCGHICCCLQFSTKVVVYYTDVVDATPPPNCNSKVTCASFTICTNQSMVSWWQHQTVVDLVPQPPPPPPPAKCLRISASTSLCVLKMTINQLTNQLIPPDFLSATRPATPSAWQWWRGDNWGGCHSGWAHAGEGCGQSRQGCRSACCCAATAPWCHCSSQAVDGEGQKMTMLFINVHAWFPAKWTFAPTTLPLLPSELPSWCRRTREGETPTEKTLAKHSLSA